MTLADEHGTESRYVNRRCRCAACRRAAAEARRLRRHANIEATRKYDRAYKRRWRGLQDSAAAAGVYSSSRRAAPEHDALQVGQEAVSA